VHPLRGKRAGRACQEARQTSRIVTCAILVRWCDPRNFSPLVLHPGNDLGHPGEDAHNYTQWLPPTTHSGSLQPNMLTIPMLVRDLGAAVCAGSICAPLVAVIDEAITLSAAGKKDLWAAMGSKLSSISKGPVKFFSSASFLWIWAVYSLTYATANVVESIALALGASPATPVLLCSTAANMGICLAKDAAFAKMFGSKDKPGEKKAGLSPTVLTLWFGRDVITQFFVFTLPILLTGIVPDMAVRLSAPVGAQYFTTPLHVLGLKLYSLPLGTTVGSQWAAVRGSLASTIIARQMRIFPAFSVGGVVNKTLRGIFARMLGA
jgi:hypothetical protein